MEVALLRECVVFPMNFFRQFVSFVVKLSLGVIDALHTISPAVWLVRFA